MVQSGEKIWFHKIGEEGINSSVKRKIQGIFCWLTQENANTTLEYENEASPEVFQEVKIYSCVEVTVRKVKRQYRILRISAEHNTSARITDDIPLLYWIPPFAMRFLNKMRTGR